MTKEKQPETKTRDVKTTKSKAHVMRPKGEPRPMPSDYSISLGAKGDADQQLFNPGTERRQPMQGFEDTYVDIIDYIVRITHKIWEEKDIGYIYDTYAHNSRVWDGMGLQYGRDKIVADTVHTVNAFPNVRLYADEIVWAGNDEVGFHTSHRTVIKGTNTGFSRFGPPTGRNIEVWCIANCIALNNEIFEEWVLYDNAHLIRQLGFDLVEKAREAGNNRKDIDFQDPRSGQPERLLGQGKPKLLKYNPGDTLDIPDFLQTTYHNIWNRRHLSVVQQSHNSSLTVLSSNGRKMYGRGAFQSYILSFLAMFPDLAFEIDDIYWMGNDKDDYITSMRWTIKGHHGGWGIYGPPTNRPVRMWGITQHHIRNGEIHAEWMMFNEFELMQQIFKD